MRSEYDRVQNIVKCGYELNRIALLLHLFSLFKTHYLACVIGVFCVIVSYTCVYFAESYRVYLEDEKACLPLAYGTMIFTALSYILWFANQLIWR
jgi:uncharacterized protein YfbU (UPF0304 family)